VKNTAFVALATTGYWLLPTSYWLLATSNHNTTNTTTTITTTNTIIAPLPLSALLAIILNKYYSWLLFMMIATPIFPIVWYSWSIK